MLKEIDQLDNILVLKSNGDQVPFDRNKILNALKLAGAKNDESYEILKQIELKLYNGIPTRKIFQLAYSLLKKKKSHRVAGRYRLKKAIFEMGPSGYPFEIFIGALFESFGYKVKVGQQVQGKCVQHEIDVIAIKPGEQIIIECKFHGDYRAKTNVQVPLYINSRFNDIKDKWVEEDQYKELNIKGYVVTNSRFTQDAIKYAECAGLGLISWDYPKEGSLKYFIDKSGLHPITSLHTLNKTQRKHFLDEGIVLCRELLKHEDLMRKYLFSDNQISKVLGEVKVLIDG